jgi:predicted lipoprotein with Yx(FWY)xxD motif
MRLFHILALGMAALFNVGPVWAASFTVPAAPPGVTFQMNFKVLPGAGGGGDGLTLVYADDKGHSLYISDTNCNDDCLKAWPPFVAPLDAKTGGAWSVITREDGRKQWALRGKPLFLSAKDEKAADMKGIGEGWHLASIIPTDGIILPYDISARELADAGGQSLVTIQNLTLYVFDDDKDGQSHCVGECTAEWQPYQAGAISNAVGDFSVLVRPDGIKQWAYKKQPLYTYIADEQPGDIYGHAINPKWRVALLTQYPMPADVKVARTPRHGTILSLKDGQTLYAQDIVRFTGGGVPHANRMIARGLSYYGRMIGVGCIDKCTETHKPYLAPVDAQASGYWSVITRPDGQRQWAYLDFPLYTFTGDTKPGDVKSHDVADITIEPKGNNEPPFTAAPVGIYWRVALP